MTHFPPLHRTPFGPWADPRNPHPGGAASPVPDIEWPDDSDGLYSAVDTAARHALLDHLYWERGVGHFVWDSVWVRISPDFERHVVTVEASLLDQSDLSDGGSISPLIRDLQRTWPHVWFAADDHGLVLRSTLWSVPFIPAHLGQVLLEFIQLGEAIVEGDRWDRDQFRTVTQRAYVEVPPPFCGTSMIWLQSQYASIAGHPLHDRPCEEEDDFDWEE